MAVVLPFVPRGQGFAGRMALEASGRLYRQYSAIKALLVGVYNGHLLLGASEVAIKTQLHVLREYEGDDAATAHWSRAALLEDVEPIAPLHLDDVPALAPDEPLQPPPQAPADAVPTNRTALRLWLTSAAVMPVPCGQQLSFASK